MRPHEIDAQLRQRPFVPFRLHLSDQSYYDVKHPEMAMVSRTVISLALYGEPGTDMPERIVLCDPIHVTRLDSIGRHATEATQ